MLGILWYNGLCPSHQLDPPPRGILKLIQQLPAVGQPICQPGQLERSALSTDGGFSFGPPAIIPLQREANASCVMRQSQNGVHQDCQRDTVYHRPGGSVTIKFRLKDANYPWHLRGRCSGESTPIARQHILEVMIPLGPPLRASFDMRHDVAPFCLVQACNMKLSACCPPSFCRPSRT
jgi:hypothetical protein